MSVKRHPHPATTIWNLRLVTRLKNLHTMTMLCLHPMTNLTEQPVADLNLRLMARYFATMTDSDVTFIPDHNLRPVTIFDESVLTDPTVFDQHLQTATDAC
jgi:hypothetical protein